MRLRANPRIHSEDRGTSLVLPIAMLLVGGSPFPSTPTTALFRRRALRCSASVPVQEAGLVRRAAEVADLSAGRTSPHPNFGCVIARGVDVVGEGFLYAQGTKCAELQAVEMAGALARGATAYLNMEPGDCYSDHTAVSSLVQVGIAFSLSLSFFFLLVIEMRISSMCAH